MMSIKWETALKELQQRQAELEQALALIVSTVNELKASFPQFERMLTQLNDRVERQQAEIAVIKGGRKPSTKRKT